MRSNGYVHIAPDVYSYSEVISAVGQRHRRAVVIANSSLVSHDDVITADTGLGTSWANVRTGVVPVAYAVVRGTALTR